LGRLPRRTDGAADDGLRARARLAPDDGSAATTLADADRSARRFLAENVAVFGEWSDLLDLDLEASLKPRDGHWQVVYRQRVNGVRVENARLDLHVVHGRMVLMGAENWSRPATRGVPAVGAGEALGLLESYLGDDAAGLMPAGEPKLALIATAAETPETSRAPGPERGAPD